MNRSKIYLDMDGVVADFRSRAIQVIGRDAPNASLYPDADWNRLRDDPHLFRHLPLMPGAQELVDLARRFRDELGWELLFLTAIPHNNDLPWAFHDKAAWAHEHFPDIAVHFGPYSDDKPLHCSSGDILVDDRLSNCQEWAAAGGVAVRVGRTLVSAQEELRGLYQQTLDAAAAALQLRRLVVEIL